MVSSCPGEGALHSRERQRRRKDENEAPGEGEFLGPPYLFSSPDFSPPDFYSSDFSPVGLAAGLGLGLSSGVTSDGVAFSAFL